MAAVGAAPDVVAAAERWAQVRVDNLARHQAAVAREAAGGDLATDPDYVAVYAVFTAPAFEADTPPSSTRSPCCVRRGRRCPAPADADAGRNPGDAGAAACA